MNLSTVLAGHAKTEEEHRHDICIVGRWMYEHEYIVACEGNVSVRLADGRPLRRLWPAGRGFSLEGAGEEGKQR